MQRVRRSAKKKEKKRKVKEEKRKKEKRAGMGGSKRKREVCVLRAPEPPPLRHCDSVEGKFYFAS